MRVFLEGLGTGIVDRLELARPNVGLGGGGELLEVGDVIVVGVREEDVFHLQLLGVDRVDHGVGVGARVEGGRELGAGVPHEVAVDGHVLERRVERREAGGKVRLFGIPGLGGQDLEGVGPEMEVPGDAADDGDKGLAALHRSQVGEADLGALCEILVADLQPALGLVDDVVEVILEGNASHARAVKRGAQAARKP